MILVFAGLGFMAFLGASMLAVDVGMFMTARVQAQNAADAAAISGATALYYDDYADRSTSGPAVQNAIAAGTANRVMGSNVSVTPGDVTFPPDPLGLDNRVRVRVFRTAGRANPLATMLGGFFGVTSANLEALATAEASPVNAETCVKPFTIPDKWIERQTPPWDPSDTFDSVDKKGNPLPNPDVYVPTSPTQFGSGYDPGVDTGLQVVIKAGTGHNIAPSFYYALALPGSSGAADYRWNIGYCNTSIVRIGDLLTAEPGNMVGPTRQGVQDLIDRDPGAYWDSGSNRVVSGMHPSPRVAVIPLFDPEYYETGKQNGRNADLRASNFLGIFIEGLQGGDVVARVTPVGGLIEGGGPVPIGSFPRVIRLIE